MDFYVIPPLNHLSLMEKGDRFFCLAQLYMKSEEYRQFFKQKVAQGKWVTLDNGAGDHDLVNPTDLLAVVKDLRPSEVIPPDFIGNAFETIRALEKFISWMKDGDLLKTTQVFGCPQGATREHWLFTYEYMLNHPNVSTIGFSKIAIPMAFLNATNDAKIKESRWMAYDFLMSRNLIRKPIHLLGMGDPTEMIYYRNNPLIRSTDSCNTVWSAMMNKDFTKNQFDRVPTPKDYFDRTIPAEQWSLVLSNILWFAGILK